MTHEEAEPDGLASLLGGLIEQNLEREPARARYLKPAVVSIEARGAGVGATLRFSRRSVSISGQIARGADVSVIADPNDLLALTAAPLRSGFPDPLRSEGRAVLAAIGSGRVRVRGLFGHPLLVRRLILLLSVA